MTRRVLWYCSKHDSINSLIVLCIGSLYIRPEDPVKSCFPTIIGVYY